jgi:DNA-binding NarL/FixJ family response regulator
MGSQLHLQAHEQRLILDLMSVLSASLDLHEVLRNAYDPLLQLVASDYGALAISRPGDVETYDWIVTRLPEQFLGRYGEMASHDFVRAAVITRPNVVMTDTEMIERPQLERNMMYYRARELGSPIEHVMAVMLHVSGSWQSGLSLYRERRRPFSDHERALLQHIVPGIRNTVSNCRLFGEIAMKGSVFDALVQEETLACVIATGAGAVVERTAAAAALMAKWFSPLERSGATLPKPILENLLRLSSAPALQRDENELWARSIGDAEIRVRFLPVPKPRGLWALLFREARHSISIPAGWRDLLTKQEQEVVLRLFRGWSNAVIAEDLRCRESTVKTHLYRIFNKLGLSSRTALIQRAAQVC